MHYGQMAALIRHPPGATFPVGEGYEKEIYYYENCHNTDV